MRSRFSRNFPALLAGAVGAVLVVGPSAFSQATEQQELPPGVASWSQYFGAALAMSDDVMVVGAPHRADAAFQTSGGADVFRRDPVTGAWALEATLLDSDSHDVSYFGYAVAVDGDVIVVGAPSHTASGVGRAGAAYVFRFDATTTTWVEEQKLESNPPGMDAFFGGSVGVSGDAIVVGEPGGSNGLGCAFVFRYQDPTTLWSREAQLVDANGFVGDRAGHDVAIDGATVAVGTPIKTASSAQSGAVAVWTASGATWTWAQELTPSVTTTALCFGRSLALRGNQLLVGAPTESDATTGLIGGAYLFERSGSTFTLNHRFQPPATAYNLEFGYDVAVNGGTIVIGQPFDSMNNPVSGSAWIFRRRGANAAWVQDQLLFRGNPAFDDELGATVAMNDTDIALGARYCNQYGQDEGAVDVYDARVLTLELSPRFPVPGGSIDLEAHRGDPGAPILLVVGDIGGAPTFVPLFLDVFQASHAWSLQTSAPNPALGLTVGLRAYAIAATGGVVASNLAYVDV